MDVLILIGRILYGLIFVGSGIGHLTQTAATAGYAESRGMKNPGVLIQLSGILILAGGLGVILGIWADLAALGLAFYTLVSAFLIHHFWTDTDQMTKTMEMTGFMKNLAIVGGGLILYSLLVTTPVGLMIVGPFARP